MTSLSVLAFAEISKGIIPSGVFQVITGSGHDVGQAILEHPDLCRLALTGSTEVGYTVAKAAADKLIPSMLELGGMRSVRLQYIFLRIGSRCLITRFASSSVQIEHDFQLVRAIHIVFNRFYAVIFLYDLPYHFQIHTIVRCYPYHSARRKALNVLL